MAVTPANRGRVKPVTRSAGAQRWSAGPGGKAWCRRERRSRDTGRRRDDCDERRRGPDRAAHRAGQRAAAHAVRGRDHPRGGRRRIRGVARQDQPPGAGPRRVQGTRRPGPADPLRRHRRRRSGPSSSPWPGGPTRPAGGTATPTCCPPGSRPTSASSRPSSMIRTYELQFVPGLLQTRRLRARGHPARPRRPGRGRASRRAADAPPGGALRTRTAPTLWAVDRRGRAAPLLAGAELLRDQLDHLIALNRARRTCRCRSRRCSYGGHAAAGGPFTILRFAEPDLPDIVYLEQLTSALYLDKRVDVDHYAWSWTGCARRSSRPIAPRPRSSTDPRGARALRRRPEPASPLPQRHGLDPVRLRTPSTGAGRPCATTWSNGSPPGRAGAARRHAGRAPVVGLTGPIAPDAAVRSRARTSGSTATCRSRRRSRSRSTIVHRDERLVVVDKPHFLATIPRGRHVVADRAGPAAPRPRPARRSAPRTGSTGPPPAC